MPRPRPDDPFTATAEDAATTAVAECEHVAAPPALRDVSLQLSAGSAHVIVGAAGAGKSILLDVLGAAAQSTRGRLALLGADPWTLAPDARQALRARIGRVYQDLRLVDDLPAFDNVALMPRLLGRRRAAYAPEVAELLTWVGLGERMTVPAGDLREAERRRLAIARAVINRPALLLADEPAGALDAAAGRGVLRLLAEISRAGTTLVIATRDEAMAARSGAVALRLAAGRLAPFVGGERPGAA